MRNPNRFTILLNWVSLSKPKSSLKLRSFATQTQIHPKPTPRSRNEIRRVTQIAMFDYFHHTRGLQFLIAESMSKNAPFFNDNLLRKLNLNSDSDSDLIRSITRFLWFHPVNEFEPFLESLGLNPSDSTYLIPCDKMFLKEDAFLLENYHVFWNYGIDRKKMGKIFREAREVFAFKTGVLASKIKAYEEELGFRKPILSKLIVCTPKILIGDSNLDLVLVLEMLNSIGFDNDWVIENLSEEESYNWSSLRRVLAFLEDLCVDTDEFRDLIKERPRVLFEESGLSTMILAGFVTKLGCSRKELVSLLRNQGLGFSVSNLRQCFSFLTYIKMESDEIGRIFRCHSSWIGLCRLKQTSTLLLNLKGGKRRLCQVIRENPEEMKKWVVGLRVKPLPGVDIKPNILKTRFLLDLGYEENSKEMERAVKGFRGRGSELQKRFDFLVSLGFDEGDVRDMVKASPGILTQASEVLRLKVNYLVGELGYPISTLVCFPSCLKYTLERMKVRFAMFAWLKRRGIVDSDLAVSTILVYSDKSFASRYLKRHPDGPEHYAELKKRFLCE